MARVCALPTITDDSALGGAVIEKSLVFNNFTPTLNNGLCFGPVFEMSLYVGSFLNFLSFIIFRGI